MGVKWHFCIETQGKLEFHENWNFTILPISDRPIFFMGFKLAYLGDFLLIGFLIWEKVLRLNLVPQDA